MENTVLKDEILSKLNSKFKSNNIRFPLYIDFNINNKILHIKLVEKSCTENLQKDYAAFEGWAICIKYHLPELIENVLLDWEEVKDLSKNYHYNRFLYRVIRFNEMFDWFKYENKYSNEIEDFKLKMSNLNINTPASEASKSTKKAVSEKNIEYNNLNHQHLKNHFHLTTVNRQLPVGVQLGGKSFFTGNGSAIDLWGIDNEDSLYIFELKYQNKKVGIISELLFYSEVMYDVFISNKINKPNKIQNFRDALGLYDLNVSVNTINAYFLTDKLHPLVIDTIDLLNTNKLGIVFYNQYYSLSEGDKIELLS